MSDAEILALTANLGASLYQSLTVFDVEKKIGKGQFSVVYRARCRKDGAVVALKKVQIFEMMDAKARLDCMKEISLLQVGFLCLVQLCHELHLNLPVLTYL
jgi:NIMA (never in mitosis gene a)-related kinase